MGKQLNKSITKTEYDRESGEFSRVYSEQTIGWVDSEPDYIKIYIGTQLTIMNLDPSLAQYIVAFGPFMTYANDNNYEHMIQTNIIVRQSVANTLGVSVKRVDQIVKKLVEGKIFIPVYHEAQEKIKDVFGNPTGEVIITRKKRRGIYFVNPWVVAKGKWNDIKELRQQIDFVSGKTTYLITDDNGSRKFTQELPVKSQVINKGIPGQMSLDLEDKGEQS